MKKQLIVLAVGLMAFASTSFAQGGGFQRKTPEERTKDVMEKLGPLNLDKKTCRPGRFRILTLLSESAENAGRDDGRRQSSRPGNHAGQYAEARR